MRLGQVISLHVVTPGTGYRGRVDARVVRIVGTEALVRHLVSSEMWCVPTDLNWN